MCSIGFFFNHMPSIQINTLSLHNALPISWDKLKDYRRKLSAADQEAGKIYSDAAMYLILTRSLSTDYKPTIRIKYMAASERSEEHTSELQSLRHLVCRLLLEYKNVVH